MAKPFLNIKWENFTIGTIVGAVIVLGMELENKV